jgi:hypothetical protein
MRPTEVLSQVGQLTGTTNHSHSSTHHEQRVSALTLPLLPVVTRECWLPHNKALLSLR